MAIQTEFSDILYKQWDLCYLEWSVETNNTEVTWELAKDGASLFVSWSAGPEPTHYTVETLYPEIPALDTA